MIIMKSRKPRIPSHPDSQLETSKRHLKIVGKYTDMFRWLYKIQKRQSRQPRLFRNYVTHIPKGRRISSSDSVGFIELVMLSDSTSFFAGEEVITRIIPTEIMETSIIQWDLFQEESIHGEVFDYLIENAEIISVIVEVIRAIREYLRGCQWFSESHVDLLRDPDDDEVGILIKVSSTETSSEFIWEQRRILSSLLTDSIRNNTDSEADFIRLRALISVIIR